jgi:hypothetical protein
MKRKALKQTSMINIDSVGVADMPPLWRLIGVRAYEQLA